MQEKSSFISASKPDDNTYPLVGPQVGIWLADQLSESSNAFSVAQYVEIMGSINIDLLSQAIHIGLCEADTIHSEYHQEDQGPVQCFKPAPTPESLNAVDIVRIEETDHPIELAKVIMLNDIQGDDRADSGIRLYHHIIFQLPENSNGIQILWYQRYHHLMVDGFSFNALTKRIEVIYNALLNKAAIPDSPFTAFTAVIDEYLDYAMSEKCQTDKDFWRNYAKEMSTPLSLSNKNTGLLENANSLVHRRKFCIDRSIIEELTQQSDAKKLSVIDISTAIIFIYLSRMCDSEQVTVGYPFMRRMGSAALSATGPVANILPLQLEVRREQTLFDIARSLSRELRKIRKHQRYEAEQLQRDLGLVGSHSRLYGATINCKIFDYALDFNGTLGTTQQLATGPIEDVEFSIYFGNNTITIELAANAHRYELKELELHKHRISNLFTQAHKNRQILASEFSLIPENEQSLIDGWAKGTEIANTEQYISVLDIFSQQVQTRGRDTAIVFNGQTVSFEALSYRALQICIALQQEGISTGDIIAVALPRSIDAIASILAILYSGATYLPLDLTHPDERIAVMCEDAQPAQVITLSSQANRLAPKISQLHLDTVAPPQFELPFDQATVTNGDQRAYIFYTSGSTGKPKGVMVPHGALLNLALALQDEIFKNANTRSSNQRLKVALTGSFSFDTSWDPILLLMLGHELYLFDDDAKRDVYGLIDSIRSLKIDTLSVAPSLATQLLEGGLMEAGHHHPILMDICGEAVSPALWSALRQYPQLQAHNIYGPTEFTVYATSAQVLPELPEPVIGRPLANTELYVLDKRLMPVPIGVAGELYLAGDNMTLGYLRRPETTAIRFVANPYRSGDVMYLTGDLVRWSTAGQLEFIGRSDNQVKVRGFRVELGDVEAAFSALEETKEVAVIARPIVTGNQLLAYCTLKPTVKSTSKDKEQEVRSRLLQQLKAQLPDYMVPSSLVILSEFPLTVSGKLDKKALPIPSVPPQQCSRPAKNTEEQLVCDAIAKILDLDSIGAEDDFFQLGGDSISAMRLCTAMRNAGYDLRPKEIFQLRSPAQIALNLNAILYQPEQLPLNTAKLPLNQVEKKYGPLAAVLPVLPLQAGLLFQVQLGSEENSYSFTTKLELTGELNIPRLRSALDSTLSMHPQLGALFDCESWEAPLQLIPRATNDTGSMPHWPLTEVDLSQQPDQLQQEMILALELQQAKMPFDIPTHVETRTPLLHAHIIKMAAKNYSLLITAHHLVIDGWSTPILLQDLLGAYRKDSHRVSTETNRYIPIVSQLANRDQRDTREHWHSLLRGVIPTLAFAESRDKETVHEIELPLCEQLHQQLNKLCQQEGLTFNTLIQGVWGALLGSITGRNDVVFGSPVSGRSSAVEGIDEVIGLFSNTLPVRVQLEPQQPLIKQLQSLQEQQIALFDHDGIGLGEIQRIAGSDTLFDTLLVVENYPADKVLLQQDHAGLQLNSVKSRGFTHYPLTILVLPGDNPRILFEYRDAVANAEYLAQRFINLLTQLAESPKQPLASMSLQVLDEQLLIQRINDTNQHIAPATLRDLMILQAQKSPTGKALTDENFSLDYQSMRRQVCNIASQLNINRIGPGDIVAVAIDRSIPLSLALQAVIEAGAAYLPLDIDYPDERLALMLEDANPKLILAGANQVQRFGDNCPVPCPGPVLSIETLLCKEAPRERVATEIRPEDPAYLIYTSGSTGRPKGVLVSHAAIVNRLQWMQSEYRLQASDVVLQKTPSSFDVSVWEFFWPLIQGAELVMAPAEAHRDPKQLLETILQHQVTTMHFVPSMLAAMMDYLDSQPSATPQTASLRRIFCSGEALSKELASAYANYFNAPLHNLYGPTEAAVDVTHCAANPNIALSEGTGVPIGKPVWNTQLRILDQFLRPVGIGVPGELYLSGKQLAIGYLNRHSLTAERFVADPYAVGERMYRTGDVVRWLADGNVEYIGRSDDQIKIRGLRIEIGEIEKALVSLPHVRQAAVHARALNRTRTTGDNRQLVAYVILENSSETPTALRPLLDQLAQTLPAHMVPSTLVAVDSFPLSANGKLDRKALPDPQIAQPNLGRAPNEGTEQIIANSFCKLLDIESVTAEANFFELGGHSLLAMRLAAELRQALTLPVTVGQIMVSPTTESLAAVLTDEKLRKDPEKAGFGNILPIRTGAGTALFCINPGSGFSWQYTGFPKYLAGRWPIIGLQSPRPNGAVAISENMGEAVDRYLQTLLSVQPEGPYHLMGYSFGGTVTVALASKLTALGHEVAFVGLFDTYPPEGQEWKRPTENEAKEEVEREKRQFLNAAEGEFADEATLQEQTKMFNDIVANYDDAVRLLSDAYTQPYSGNVQLFVAEKTLPDGWDVEKSWASFLSNMQQHRLPFAHDDILSPRALEVLGPLLNGILAKVPTLNRQTKNADLHEAGEPL
ncbi:amino acid adenylation domain-containing protein [Microbulbifer sp. OS29]|uniref:Amino acid adenylation domain-containing protein n=1 Tax=Microbulbifer okhotskensis TaxID=2926617 RepID=A0A9X2J4V8_9GAMM|nr:non-ribosomal peptide synthetase [Microbulbifer okhotskensis]MCO1334528.1 amino acid adenylation domain-containing protein [Microbulbifer okhotskensis]